MINIRKVVLLIVATALTLAIGSTSVYADGEIEVNNFAELKAAVQSSGKIKLMADFELNQTIKIPATSSVELDLNGHQITKGNGLGGNTSIENRGVLTVLDNNNGQGLIKARLLDNYGTINMQGGIIESNGIGGGAAIWNNPGGIANITGGTLKVSGVANNTNSKAPIPLVNEGQATVIGGQFDSKFTNISNQGQITISNVNLKVSTNNWIAFKSTSGTATLNNVTTEAINGGCYSSEGATSVVNLNNSSCTQNGAVDWNSTLVAASNNGKIYVNGGNYQGGVGGYGLYVFSTGGEIVVQNSAVIKADTAIKTGHPNSSIVIEDGVIDGKIDVKQPTDLKLATISYENTPDNRQKIEASKDSNVEVFEDAQGRLFLSKPHTLTYENNASDATAAPVDNNIYPDGAQITVADGATMERPDYEFDGWNSKRDGSGQQYSAGAIFTMPNDSDGVLYAQWKAVALPVVIEQSNIMENKSVARDNQEQLADTGSSMWLLVFVAIASVISGALTVKRQL